MSRKKQSLPPPIEPTIDYWELFLKKMGFISDVVKKEEEHEEEGEGVELPADPEFLEFLKVASTYGAPKNLKEFKEKNREDQLFYLGAYKEYLKEEQKRLRAERLKTHR